MANFQSVNAKATYVSLKDSKLGDVLAEGRYESTFVDQYQKKRYRVKTNAGVVILPSNGDLNYKMDNFVSMGAEVRVVYLGKKSVKTKLYGMKEIHEFDVQVDQDIPTIQGASNVEEDTGYSFETLGNSNRQTSGAESGNRSFSASTSNSRLGGSAIDIGEDSKEDSKEDLFAEENGDREKEVRISESKKTPSKQMSREDILAKMNSYRPTKA